MVLLKLLLWIQLQHYACLHEARLILLYKNSNFLLLSCDESGGLKFKLTVNKEYKCGTRVSLKVFGLLTDASPTHFMMPSGHTTCFVLCPVVGKWSIFPPILFHFLNINFSSKLNCLAYGCAITFLFCFHVKLWVELIQPYHYFTSGRIWGQAVVHFFFFCTKVAVCLL